MTEPLMNSKDVVDFCNEVEELGIKIWIDGGWGVDALLGEQMRPHADLDIFIEEKDVLKLRELLEGKGYQEVKLEIARPHNFVLGDNAGHEVDVHVITFDSEGRIIYGPVENGEIYPPDLFSGVGVINGRKVKCISAEWVVKWHTGYQPRENDFKDVTALCRKFNLDYPEEYRLKEL
jgi:lincosamide nucleotidyltransferase A/C/D/E